MTAPVEPTDEEREAVRARAYQQQAEHQASADASKGGKGSRSESLAVALIEIGSELPLFADSAGRAYCLRELPGGGTRAAPLTSRDFRHWLAGEFFRREGCKRVAPAEAIANALAVLHARACEAEQVEVSVRVADHAGAIYLDLGDDAGRAVEMTSEGWSVVDRTPVAFRRPPGMLALPVPTEGGSVEDLRDLVNCGDDDWRLVVAWLVAALRPGRPFPILAWQGPHGSAKTTAARLVRGLIDPAKPALRKKPRDERSLSINAQNSWVLSYDNLSGLPEWLSDALCGIATGSGFGDRLLHSDFEEALFDSKRPIMGNGIDEIACRPDFADRALRVTLREIPDSARLEEAEIDAHYEAIRPGVLGALCTAVSGALELLPATHLERKPRMADFARWAVAAEDPLGWPPGSFLKAYMGNRAELAQHSLQNDDVAQQVVALLSRCPDGRWEGTTGELLDVLTEQQRQIPKDWPQNPKGLANKLRRAAPVLRRAAGIEFTEPAPVGHSNRRILTLQRRGSQGANDARSNPASTDRGSEPLSPEISTAAIDANDAIGTLHSGPELRHPLGCLCAGDDCALNPDPIQPADLFNTHPEETQ